MPEEVAGIRFDVGQKKAKTFTIVCKDGSTYTIKHDVDGRFWLAGTNVPDWDGVIQEHGWWELAKPRPWLPYGGKSLHLEGLLPTNCPQGWPSGSVDTAPVRTIIFERP